MKPNSNLPHESDQAIAQPSVEDSACKRFLSTNLGRSVEIAVVFSPAIFAIAICGIIKLESPFILMSILWLANVTMLVLVGLGIRLRNKTWGSIGARFGLASRTAVGRAIAKSLPILLFAIVGFIFGSIVGANVVGIPEGANMSNYNFLQSNLPMLVVSLAGVYLVSSFGEEVIYRGFLITRIEEMFRGPTKLAVATAVVVSSVVFGFAHFGWGPMGIIQTTFMGAALGVSFLMTQRNIWPLVLAHGYMDTILLVQLYLAAPPIE